MSTLLSVCRKLLKNNILCSCGYRDTQGEGMSGSWEMSVDIALLCIHYRYLDIMPSFSNAQDRHKCPTSPSAGVQGHGFQLDLLYKIR